MFKKRLNMRFREYGNMLKSYLTGKFMNRDSEAY